MERIPPTRPIGAILLAISLITIAGVLFLRRVSVPGLADLPAGEVALWAAAFAVLAALAARRISRASTELMPPQYTLSLALLFSLVFAAGLSADPFATFAGLLAIVAALAAPLLAVSSQPAAPGRSHSENRSQEREITSEPRHFASETSQVNVPFDDSISQTLTRRLIGSDCYVEGMLAFEIPRGERVHQLHIPFWPALPAAPVVECEIDECDARVHVPLAAPHGLRIEIRVLEPSDEVRPGILHFTAHASASRAAA